MTECKAATKKKKPRMETLTLHYDLADLPSAQHKAGLAGLVLAILTMEMHKLNHAPQILDFTEKSASFVFTIESFQALFNFVYDASIVEIESASKWTGKEPKRIVERQVTDRSGKTKTEKRFVYDAYQPKGDFLAALYPEDGGAWLKLWRDVVWNTLRGIPKTRIVYEQRAENKQSSLAPKMWDSLEKDLGAGNSSSVTEPLAGPLFIGAQDINAERVPFQGSPVHNLLLHFWSIAAAYFVPVFLDSKGDFKDRGFVIVVPEPSSLKSFVEDTKEFFRQLDTEVLGYRPKASRIDLPEEGGLEYLHSFASSRLQNTPIARSLAAVEIYHLEKRGNSIATLAAERLLPHPAILAEYESLRKNCRNPVFKFRRIKNLLSQSPWYEGMERDFAVWPWEFFIWAQGKTPRKVPFYGTDAKAKFESVKEDLQTLENMKGGQTMTQEDRDDILARRIHALIQNFVNRRAEKKSGVKFSDFKQEKDEKGRTSYPPAYLDAREKAASEAFLAMRGRRDKDFVAYFTGTICSVPQFLPETEFIGISRALLEDWEKVKTLSMLALSACSWRRDNTKQEKGE
jgi:CRISPR-associated protein Cmx8